MENDFDFYVINDKRLVCALKLSSHSFEYKDNAWVEIPHTVIGDRLIGYDPSEPPGSPYGIGNTDIMATIKEISFADIELLFGENAITSFWRIKYT